MLIFHFKMEVCSALQLHQEQNIHMQEIIGKQEGLIFWQKKREIASHEQVVKNP